MLGRYEKKRKTTERKRPQAKKEKGGPSLWLGLTQGGGNEKNKNNEEER